MRQEVQRDCEAGKFHYKWAVFKGPLVGCFTVYITHLYRDYNKQLKGSRHKPTSIMECQKGFDHCSSLFLKCTRSSWYSDLKWFWVKKSFCQKRFRIPIHCEILGCFLWIEQFSFSLFKTTRSYEKVCDVWQTAHPWSKVIWLLLRQPSTIAGNAHDFGRLGRCLRWVAVGWWWCWMDIVVVFSGKCRWVSEYNVMFSW